MGIGPQLDMWGPALNTFNAGARLRGYIGVNLDRQTRHNARAARRYGDWGGILAVPTAMLWLDELALADEEVELTSGAINPWEPAIIDIWG